MLEIKVHVIHEWRPGHADPLARIEKGLKLMTDIATRLEASVSALATAIDNQNVAVAEVATAIRNHPASTTDNGRLSALADRLDGITSSLNTTTASLHGLAGEENAEDTGGAPVSEEPPVEPAPAEEPAPTPAGAEDNSADASGDAGASSGSDSPLVDDGAGAGTSSVDGAGTSDTAGADTAAAPADDSSTAGEGDTASGDGFTG